MEPATSVDHQHVPVSDREPVDSESQSVESESEKPVSYETHRRLLGEKKRAADEARKLREQLDAYEAEKRQRAEQELVEQNKYKELLELRDKELKEAKSKIERSEEQVRHAKKLDAVLSGLDGTVDQKYWKLIPIGKVALNPDTGEPDEMSVAQVVEAFKSEYPETIKRAGGPSVSSNAPQPASAKISYEEWVKLPAKEMRARLKDVVRKE